METFMFQEIFSMTFFIDHCVRNILPESQCVSLSWINVSTRDRSAKHMFSQSLLSLLLLNMLLRKQHVFL